MKNIPFDRVVVVFCAAFWLVKLLLLGEGDREVTDETGDKSLSSSSSSSESESEDEEEEDVDAKDALREDEDAWNVIRSRLELERAKRVGIGGRVELVDWPNTRLPSGEGARRVRGDSLNNPEPIIADEDELGRVAAAAVNETFGAWAWRDWRVGMAKVLMVRLSL